MQTRRSIIIAFFVPKILLLLCYFVSIVARDASLDFCSPLWFSDINLLSVGIAIWMNLSAYLLIAFMLYMKPLHNLSLSLEYDRMCKFSLASNAFFNLSILVNNFSTTLIDCRGRKEGGPERMGMSLFWAGSILEIGECYYFFTLMNTSPKKETKQYSIKKI